MPLSARRQRFVNAYVGEAAGNGAEAARIAGYSAHTARQASSYILTSPDVQQAIQAITASSGFTVERAIEELSTIAEFKVERVTSGDKLKAIELFLKAKGALRDTSGESRVTVNIGFLGPHQPIVASQILEVSPLSPQTQVLGRSATVAVLADPVDE